MFTLNCKGRLLVIDQPIVMGIINLTPDSFFAGSRQTGISEVVRKAEQMLREGATIIDVGAQSTRPGSELIGADEELHRIIGPLMAIHKEFPEAIISVDTFYGKVALEAVMAGASIINDVSGYSLDDSMLDAVAVANVPYVLMHMRGTPSTMQEHSRYNDVTREVLDYFISKIDELRMKGINDIIVDPGFGFAKTIPQNFELLRKLEVFRMLDLPLLVGLSRKSSIYKTIGGTADDALNGTTVLNTMALMSGASILRVHDVKQAKEAILLVEACNKE